MFGRCLGRQRHHRAKKHGCAERVWPQEEERAGDIGSVGEPHRRDIPGRELVFRGRRGDEIRELRRAQFQIVDVEDPFGQAPEEPRHAAFEHPASGTQDACGGQERLGQRYEVVLVTACTVEEEQDRSATRRRRLKNVDELHL